MTVADCLFLQRVLDDLVAWTNKWQLTYSLKIFVYTNTPTETTRMGESSSDWTVVNQKLHILILDLRLTRHTLPIASNDPVVLHTRFYR